MYFLTSKNTVLCTCTKRKPCQGHERRRSKVKLFLTSQVQFSDGILPNIVNNILMLPNQMLCYIRKCIRMSIDKLSHNVIE